METITFPEDAYVETLRKLIGEVKHLQNGGDSVPKEDRAARHVMDALKPFSTDNGGPLEIKHVSYVEGRGNVMVTYPGQPDGGIMSFVGCHMDVVPANPDTWDFDPCSLTVDGDQLKGRGTTDCLGHVALITQIMRELGEKKPKLRRTVVAVFIANEENSRELGIGVDALVANGEMDHLKAGPVYWVDVADKCPCIGTGGVAAWTLKVNGKLFHSGIPQHAINSIELGMEVVAELQKRFYEDFPPHEKESIYGFKSSSSMKPTQISYPGGSVNQIPGEASFSGDIRITPFYDIAAVMERLSAHVQDIQANLDKLPTRGPMSKYTLPEEGLTGKLSFTWAEGYSRGLACRLDSSGYAALVKAFENVMGECTPMAITGSLPCIKDLQDNGYDVQTLGFGKMSTYHANNEYCLLSDMKIGFNVLCKLLENLDQEDQDTPRFKKPKLSS